jgi:hypothetical protein
VTDTPTVERLAALYDQHGWPAFKTCNQPDDVIGHDDAGIDNIAALGLGPQPVADRLARQIADGLDFGVGRELIEAGAQCNRGRAIRLADG